MDWFKVDVCMNIASNGALKLKCPICNTETLTKIDKQKGIIVNCFRCYVCNTCFKHERHALIRI